MSSNKRLTALLSCLSCVLTTTLLLLQLYGVLIIKIAQQQRQLQHLRNEAIMSRNTARSRYRRARLRLVLNFLFINNIKS